MVSNNLTNDLGRLSKENKQKNPPQKTQDTLIVKDLDSGIK